LYKEGIIEITAQIQTVKYLVRTLLTFKGMTNLDVHFTNPSEIASAVDL